MAQFNQVPQVWQRRQAASQRAGPGCAVGAASNSKFLGPTDLDYSELWPSRFAPCFAECLWMTIPELGEALDETSCATAPGRVAVVVWTCFGANRQFVCRCDIPPFIEFIPGAFGVPCVPTLVQRPFQRNSCCWTTVAGGV